MCKLCIQPSVAAKQVYTLSLNRVLNTSGCSSLTECFLYFTDVSCAAYDAYLLLSKPSSVVSLQRATLTVGSLHSSAIIRYCTFCMLWPAVFKISNLSEIHCCYHLPTFLLLFSNNYFLEPLTLLMITAVIQCFVDCR